MKEQALVNKIKMLAEEIGAVFYKNPPTVSGRPDIELIKDNKILLIETKRDGKTSVRGTQIMHIHKHAQCGNSVLVSNNIQEIREYVEKRFL